MVTPRCPYAVMKTIPTHNMVDTVNEATTHMKEVSNAAHGYTHQHSHKAVMIRINTVKIRCSWK